MAITRKDILEIQSIIEPLLGKKAWDVSLGVGSFLTFNFGNPIQKYPNQKNQFGEWYLWVQYCDWQLRKEGMEIIHSESQRQEIRQKIVQMEGLRLTSIKIYPDTVNTDIEFENGYLLNLWAYLNTEENDDLWWLFIPDGNVLAISKNEWSVSSANSPR